jgi:hypothetical protein
MTSTYIKIHDLNSCYEPTNLPGYCPISVKEEQNKPQENTFPHTNSQIFLSKKNVFGMVYYMTSLTLKNRTNPLVPANKHLNTFLTKLQKKIPDMMITWSKEQNINEFKYSADDFMTTLKFLNKKFIRDHSHLYDRANRSDSNVFHTTGRITDECNNQFMKQYDTMLADDYHTVDTWQPLNIFTDNKQNRYCNKIPIWQRSMNTRQLDKSNDGLHSSYSDRASLDNQNRGYNMDNIIKGSTSYENYYYENM